MRVEGGKSVKRTIEWSGPSETQAREMAQFKRVVKEILGRFSDKPYLSFHYEIYIHELIITTGDEERSESVMRAEISVFPELFDERYGVLNLRAFFAYIFSGKFREYASRVLETVSVLVRSKYAVEYQGGRMPKRFSY